MMTEITRHYDIALAPGQEIVQYYEATGGPAHGIQLRVTNRAA